MLGVDGHREWFRYHRLFAKLLRTRAERELRDELPRPARARRPLVRRARRRRRGARARRRRRRSGIWRVEVVAEHWFDLYVRGDAAAVRRSGGPAAGRAHRGRRRGRRGAGLRRARRRRHRRRRAAPRARRASPPPGCPSRAGAATWRRWRWPISATARLEGDFEGALEAADALLAEAAAHPPAAGDDAREALVHAMLGESALWGHRLDRAGEELTQGGHARAAARARLRRRLRAQRPRAARGDARSARPSITRHAATRRSSSPPAAAGRRSRRPRARTRRSRCARSTTSTRARPRSTWCTARAAAAHMSPAPARVRDRPPRRAPAGRARLPARRACACSTTSRRCTATAAPRRPYETASLGLDARAAADRRRRARRGRAASSPRSTTTTWLAVDLRARAPALARGEPADAVEILVAAPRQARHPRRRRRSSTPRWRRSRATRPASRSRAATALEAGAGAGRDHPPPLAVPGARAADGGAAAPPDPLTAPRIARRRRAARRCSPTARRASRNVTPLLEPLSEREQAILRYLPTALSNREIAAELFVTTNTVKTHLRSIYRKLDVARRREAVERARDLRLAQQPALTPLPTSAAGAAAASTRTGGRRRSPARRRPR